LSFQGGAAVILSVAKYESPLGKKFQDDAVTPATLVASNQDDLSAATDDADATTAAPVKRKEPATDDQLQKALEMLKAKAA
jgi:carboxyl-terminal processing protease